MSRMRLNGLALFVLVIGAAAGGCSNSSPPISVGLSPSTPQALDVGQTANLTATVTNDSSDRGVVWSLSGPGSLSGTTGLAVTYAAPTANLSSSAKAMVTATSVTDTTKSASVQITVNPYPQFPFVTLPSGTVGTPYNQLIPLVGGTAPFQWGIYDGPIITGWKVGGSVPDGLTLDTSTGMISGTPTAAGTWYFEATVTDATGVNVQNGFLSIEINPVIATANPVPFLNQPLTPTAVAPGSPGLTLSVTGTGFVSGATIDWNGKPLTTTFVDGEHLSAAVPTLSVLNPGTATVTVVNPAPGGGSSNAVYFQVGAPVPSVNFVNATNSPLAAPESWAVAIADFNGDGKPDLAVTANVRVYVWLGNGDGTFAATAVSPFPVPSPPYDDFGSPYTGQGLVVGDFNHRGHAGLAVGLFQNEAASILLGNGDGTFDYSGTLANTVGQATMALTAADFNGDGNLDLAAIESLTGSSPTILLGYSSGAFNNTGQFLQFYGVSSDGKLDLVIDGTNILLGNGDGTFTPGATLSAGGFVVVGDFNGDGKLDLAVANNLGNNVTILLGDGTGNFASANGSPITVGNQPDAIVAADFNNDGKLDLAVANYADGTVTLLLGNGDGTFTASAPFAVGTNPTGIAAADFNGDGKLDLAVANTTDGTVAIFLQQ